MVTDKPSDLKGGYDDDADPVDDPKNEKGFAAKPSEPS